VDTADRIGLPWYAGWLTDHGLIVTLLWCLFLTPGLMILIAPVLETRWLPLSPRHQFLSFFPGDIFLGLMTAGFLVLAQELPAEHRWYNSELWHGCLQGLTLIVACVLTARESRDGIYPERALVSPTKLYHNILLYAGYGYAIVATLVAVLFGSAWSWTLVLQLGFCLLPGAVWAVLVARDNTLTRFGAYQKASWAHVQDWTPFWTYRGRYRFRQLFTRRAVS